MPIFELTGRITEEGRLEVDLLPGLPSGEARVTLQVPPDATPPGTELGTTVTVEPLTGAKIVARGLLGGWARQAFTDGRGWVEAQGRQRREETPW
jgi:hypothetical protein